MTEKGKTKDERFLLALYELAIERGGKFTAVDRDHVGEKVGLHARGINTICNLLLQANFIKKNGPSAVALTPHGYQLVERLLAE
ncbi:MAG: hypothetical protein H7A37_07630 [Chlamydiales bacterium]|nr:hypothetical protein [Chlamydiia bacterium]MCP5508155.1 hypothetical protein [Chlamydiales bacterium]